MIKYSDLGPDKQLNEIVIVGSHDAGVTGGDDNVQTQSLDIAGQATAGVRFFDIRITGAVVGKNMQGDVVQLKAYHGVGPGYKKSGAMDLRTGGTREVEVKKLLGGAFGMSLSTMLNDALRFVTINPSEFLILKFDKCTNWGMIASACRSILGDKIYSGGGNVNTKTLRELGGKVICAFMGSGYKELTDFDKVGITQIKNLYKPPAGYDPDFKGLQYWGAGGTSPFDNKSFEGKIGVNLSQQSKILGKAATGISSKWKRSGVLPKKVPGCAAANPNTIGMMYWTTTGSFKSIKERNNVMWDGDHRDGLGALWRGGMESWIDTVLPKNVDPLSMGSGGMMKLFMPNIVMIDFADEGKCNLIYKLNVLASTQLVETNRKYNKARNGSIEEL